MKPNGNSSSVSSAVSGAITPTFDANANMTTDETGKQYAYDAWNLLKIVKDSGGTTLRDVKGIEKPEKLHHGNSRLVSESSRISLHLTDAINERPEIARF